MFQPRNNGTAALLETTFAHGLDNFTFRDNDYYSGDPRGTRGWYVQGAKPTRSISFAAWQALGKDAGSLVADPGFANLSTFALKPGAPPIAKLGFQPIDISHVGRVRRPRSLDAPALAPWQTPALFLYEPASKTTLAPSLPRHVGACSRASSLTLRASTAPLQAPKWHPPARRLRHKHARCGIGCVARTGGAATR